ncbi:PRC-barrel domain-containing protein [Sphingomonas donggukensis]|uniref:PRC-barrel domain-containing protein n=1 Tax=Sphingomonas donggukensis TaxID=2949093 RepID=A0ABY4TST9_9SPHN|nr:PRC-barrel domain-containing protein [Sphingomonas donggukensis]URW74890.1 PRC-barrel domain-containing protein [Sphingomonas donggukensis]
MTTPPAEAASLLLVQANVTGTLKLKSRDGDSIGTVHALMVHKGTGRTTHAVLSLGGFMGLGKSFYAVPFELLGYDIANDSYTITVDRRLLEGGPSWSNNAPVFDQAYADRVAGYYGTRAEVLAEG